MPSREPHLPPSRRAAVRGAPQVPIAATRRASQEASCVRVRTGTPVGTNLATNLATNLPTNLPASVATTIGRRPASEIAALLVAGIAALAQPGASARADCECAIEDFHAVAWSAPGGDGRTYAIVVATEPWSWHHARDRAAAVGATLASTPTTAATAFALALAHAPQAPGGVYDCAGPWLGAARAAGTASPSAGWSWVSDAPFAPAAWEAGSPTRSRFLEAAMQLSEFAPAWIDALPGPDAGRPTRSAVFVWDSFDDCDGDGAPDALEIARDPSLDADRDGALDGCGTADLNGDGHVDAADLAALLARFGSAGPIGDLDGSGLVDAADLTILLNAWG